MDSAREVAELLERLARAGPRLGEQEPARALGIAGELLLGHPDAHAERDEPRLGAVVEVALDPAELRLLHVDRAGAASPRASRSGGFGRTRVARRRPPRGCPRRCRARAAPNPARSSRGRTAATGRRDRARSAPRRRGGSPARGCRPFVRSISGRSSTRRIHHAIAERESGREDRPGPARSSPWVS